MVVDKGADKAVRVRHFYGMSRIAERITKVDRDTERGYQIRYNRHPNKKNNFTVAEMYDCYKDGMSLATIGKLYGKSRQAVYDVFRSRGYPLRSKFKSGLYVTTVYGVKWYKGKGGYLRGTIDGKRTLLHRVVWERGKGSIPEGFVLHFKDGDVTRCILSNLELVAKKEMCVRFKRGVSAKSMAA